MIFSKIKDSISEAFMISSYARTAEELLNLSDKQLADIGISKTLLEQGASAYPWRAEVVAEEIPDNVTNFDFSYVEFDKMDFPKTSKAA